MIITIPPSMELSVGDWIHFEKDSNKVMLVKVKFVNEEEMT